MSLEYTADVQKLFLEMMLQDAQSFVRVMNIYNAENFDRGLKEAANFIAEHSEKYKTMPTRELVQASTGVELKELPDLNEGHYTWFLEEFEKFTKKREIERAILQAADLIEKGEFDPVEKLVRDAIQISLTKDLGTDYWADPKDRIDRYFSSGGQVSTGWPQLDRLLYGGFSRGELNIFAGGSGSGKSLVMLNMALNWLQAGLHGVYITLELSEELCGLRTDAMLTGMSTKDIRKDIDTTTMKVVMTGRKSGTYQIKSLPAQSTINDIRAYLKEYQIKTGRRVDFLMIDYLDLLMPVSTKVSPDNLFVKDKYVSEELRNLAKELKVLMVTASQLNRGAVEEIEFDHSHISGGISKIQTADNVFGIFTSRAMRERGRYQIQCMKSRSSTGVGQKIELEYDMETMRISDAGDPNGENSRSDAAPKSNILAQIKPKSTVVDRETGEILDQPKVDVDPQSTKLKRMLAGLRSQAE